MDNSNPQAGPGAGSTRLGEPALVAALRRFWRLATAPPIPDYQPTPVVDPRERRLRELERVLDLLEQTKIRVAERGWTAGGWFDVPVSRGSARGSAPEQFRLADEAEARALLRRPSGAGAACLIGSMLLLADDQDTAHSLDDVWRAADELYEAMHERSGHTSSPPGHRYAPDQRHQHLRALTGWNDEVGRTRSDVIDLLNRGISRTITACVA